MPAPLYSRSRSTKAPSTGERSAPSSRPIDAPRDPPELASARRGSEADPRRLDGAGGRVARSRPSIMGRHRSDLAATRWIACSGPLSSEFPCPPAQSQPTRRYGRCSSRLGGCCPPPSGRVPGSSSSRPAAARWRGRCPRAVVDTAQGRPTDGVSVWFAALAAAAGVNRWKLRPILKEVLKRATNNEVEAIREAHQADLDVTIEELRANSELAWIPAPPAPPRGLHTATARKNKSAA
jgi:hypothetical protein